jgi:hypothetical protein
MKTTSKLSADAELKKKLGEGFKASMTKKKVTATGSGTKLKPSTSVKPSTKLKTTLKKSESND